MAIKKTKLVIPLESRDAKVATSIVQNDNSSYLDITLTEAGEAKDLSDAATIIMAVSKPDGTAFIDTTGSRLEALNLAEGRIGIRLTGQMVTAVGISEMSISFTTAEGVTLTTFRIAYYVTETISADVIESASDYPVFQALINRINGYINQINQISSEILQHETTINALIDREDASYNRLQSELSALQEREANLRKELRNYIATEVDAAKNSIVSTYEQAIIDKINEVATSAISTGFAELLESKVDKATGKGLSTNDYTDHDKSLVETLPKKGNTNTIIIEDANLFYEVGEVNYDGKARHAFVVEDDRIKESQYADVILHQDSIQANSPVGSQTYDGKLIVYCDDVKSQAMTANVIVLTEVLE